MNSDLDIFLKYASKIDCDFVEAKCVWIVISHEYRSLNASEFKKILFYLDKCHLFTYSSPMIYIDYIFICDEFISELEYTLDKIGYDVISDNIEHIKDHLSKAKLDLITEAINEYDHWMDYDEIESINHYNFLRAEGRDYYNEMMEYRYSFTTNEEHDEYYNKITILTRDKKINDLL